MKSFGPTKPDQLSFLKVDSGNRDIFQFELLFFFQIDFQHILNSSLIYFSVEIRQKDSDNPVCPPG